jgi:hypothetical protein
MVVWWVGCFRYCATQAKISPTKLDLAAKGRLNDKILATSVISELKSVRQCSSIMPLSEEGGSVSGFLHGTFCPTFTLDVGGFKNSPLFLLAVNLTPNGFTLT